MNNKKYIWWIAVVIALPFIVMLGLHIGIALGNYFHININVPNVDAASWFMFFGSYLAGIMTLAGVIILLRQLNIRKTNLVLNSICMSEGRDGQSKLSHALDRWKLAS